MAHARSEAQSIVAGEVAVRAGAVRSVNAGEATITASAVQRVQGDAVELERSAVGIAGGLQVEVQDSSALGVAGREVRLERVRTVFLLAPRVQGEVRTVFDWKSAVAIGVGIVLTRRLLKLLRLG